MRHLATAFAAAILISAPTSAWAQDEAGSMGTVPSMDTGTTPQAPPTTTTSSSTTQVSASTAATTPPAAATSNDAAAEEAAPKKDKKSIYSKKVGGLLWIEGSAGPTKLNINKFVNNILPSEIMGVPVGNIPEVKLKGPTLGVGVGFRFGGFLLGFRYAASKYDPPTVKQAGLELGTLIRIPYVHPYIRFQFGYAWVSGDTIGFPAIDNQTGSVTIRGGYVSTGFGLRVPVIKWLSIAGGVDLSVIGFRVKGSLSPALGGGSYDGGTAGLSVGGNLALTIHI